MLLTGFFLGVLSAGVLALYLLCRWRGIDIWIGSWVRDALSRQATRGPIDILLCVADHFEPALAGADFHRECERVARWERDLPSFATRRRDCAGNPYRHTFFYPEEEYRPEHLSKLAALSSAGYGDVEIHLHHDHDTSAGLTEKLERFKSILSERHGLLHSGGSGAIEYAFIHGNWALDNSGPDGRYCGVNNEISVLQRTGCYADFTLPAAPERAQTRKINRIYYAVDDPARPKSHDGGKNVAVGGAPPSGGLMIIQGPLTLNWISRKWGILPRIENGELSGDYPPTPARVDLWVNLGIHVEGRPEWVFVKLHTHGANEKNTSILLGMSWQDTLTYMEQKYNDGRRYRLHYVTAREMYNMVKAAEAGLTGNPERYRSYLPARCASVGGASGSGSNNQTASV